jgi:signal transduction histidine kinase
VAAEGERLSALIEASRDGVLLVGEDDSIHVMNEPARRLLGLAGVAANWLEKPVALVAQRLRDGDAAAAADLLASVAGAGEQAREGDFESPAGIVRFSAQAVMSQGSALGRLLILRDVTEERRVERLREDLSHTMVHDLRSPLTSILGSLEVLDRSASAPDHELLELAARAARRLLGLVDAILDVSRLEKGAMPLKHTAVDVARLVHDVLELQEPRLRERGVRVTGEIPAELPPVLADPDVIARVLENLVGNAVKFGGRDVRLAASLAEEASAVRISVADDGPGIAADQLSRIFEKFVTGDHKVRGSGIGLAFCKLAVEAHGGVIRVESAPGRGATFSFTLPVATH